MGVKGSGSTPSKSHLELFSKGSKVEVRSDDEGFKGSWYVATVVEPPPPSSNKTKKRKKSDLFNKYLIEYETLLSDEDGSKPLREYVDVSFIRPLPSTCHVNDTEKQQQVSFELNDVVDAFHRDGWWTGVIVKIVEEYRRFAVLFQNPVEEIEFDRSELRVHLDWVDYIWVRPQKQFAPCEDTATPMQTSSGETRRGFLTPATGDEINWSKKSLVGDQLSPKSGNPYGMNIDNVTGKQVRRKRSASKLQVQGPHASTTGKEGNRSATPVEEIVEHMMEEPDLAVKKINGSQADNRHQLQNEASLKLIGHPKKHLNELEIQIVKETNKSKGEETIERDKRGRPKKSLVKRPQSSVEDAEEHNGAGVAGYSLIVKDCARNEAEMPIASEVGFPGWTGSLDQCSFQIHSEDYLKFIHIDKKQLMGSVRQSLPFNIITIPHVENVKQSNETGGQRSRKRPKKHVRKGGRMRSTIRNRKSSIQDWEDACRAKTSEFFEIGSLTKDVETVVDEMPSSIFDDQPLLKWLEEMRSPAQDGSSPGLSANKIVDQYAEESERRDKNAMLCYEVANDDRGFDKGQIFPFLMTSPLWKTIETMEVFCKMPQKPHFSPLHKCREDLREGLAIATLVTFANIVERTSKSQLTDPRSVIDSSLETLNDLKKHGFDVKAIEVRLNELLLVKDKLGLLQDEAKKVEGEIMKHDLEKTKVEEEINKIEEKMKELRERFALAMSAKEIKDDEIANLQSKVIVISDDIHRAQLEFGRLAAAPW